MAVIEHEVEIRASRQAVFSLVSRVEEFVHYSEAIETITRVNDNRYRWTVRAAGIPLSFDVEITESVPPERFSWRSITGVPNRGTYHLIPVDGGTRIHLHLEYDLNNALVEEAVRKAGKPLIRRLSREIIENVEARLRSGARGT
ncbi:cyclase [Thioalkalivibrio denitrificans]|uniref:Cyclase n=1 Tax=Thioalkalivibrio denitrificans TaxID=108003 RepID=A0A1V3NCP8_9GAMM|nr:SRPBCC family protein [Thioalkalivibrio denitrificans]OOG22713.1 cyclase [Thioalkalivibrio denitrificans]